MSTSTVLKAGQAPLMVGQRWKDKTGKIVELLDYNCSTKYFIGKRNGHSNHSYNYQGYEMFYLGGEIDLVELIETGPLFEAGQLWLRANGAQLRLRKSQDVLRAYFVNPEDDEDEPFATAVEWHRPDPYVNLVKLLQPNNCCLTAPLLKPPLGLRPRFVVLEERIKEINKAIERYRQAQKTIPAEWYNEKSLINDELDLLSFNRWWDLEGSGMAPEKGEDQEAHVHRISRIAWSNGFFKARCYEATL